MYDMYKTLALPIPKLFKQLLHGPLSRNGEFEYGW